MKTTRRDFITATGAVIACAALPTPTGPFAPHHEDKQSTITCYKQTPQGERLIKFEDIRKGDHVRFDNHTGQWIVQVNPRKQLMNDGPTWTWGCTVIPA